MKLSPLVNKYFLAWINSSTWNTGHDADRRRFYKFVKAVVKYSQKRPSSGTVRRLILAHGKGKLEESVLDSEAAEYASLYDSILGFADIQFPDPLVERKNASSHYFGLCAAFGPEAEDRIDKIMKREWGSDWKKKVFRH